MKKVPLLSSMPPVLHEAALLPPLHPPIQPMFPEHISRVRLCEQSMHGLGAQGRCPGCGGRTRALRAGPREGHLTVGFIVQVEAGQGGEAAEAGPLSRSTSPWHAALWLCPPLMCDLVTLTPADAPASHEPCRQQSGRVLSPFY